MAWTNTVNNIQIQNISAFAFYDAGVPGTYNFPVAAVEEAEYKIDRTALMTRGDGNEISGGVQAEMRAILFYDELSSAEIAKLKAERDIRDNAGNYFYFNFTKGSVTSTLKFYNCIADMRVYWEAGQPIRFEWIIKGEMYLDTQLLDIDEA